MGCGSFKRQRIGEEISQPSKAHYHGLDLPAFSRRGDSVTKSYQVLFKRKSVQYVEKPPLREDQEVSSRSHRAISIQEAKYIGGVGYRDH